MTTDPTTTRSMSGQSACKHSSSLIGNSGRLVLPAGNTGFGHGEVAGTSMGRGASMMLVYHKIGLMSSKKKALGAPWLAQCFPEGKRPDQHCVTQCPDSRREFDQLVIRPLRNRRQRTAPCVAAATAKYYHFAVCSSMTQVAGKSSNNSLFFVDLWRHCPKVIPQFGQKTR